ncbi:hypothetical protein BV22DRAFT_1048487 [Leucogyrophana mollusca]|uniref:Uncharacterized protein n=1 Tax=Leucogyrophana mollusca TaxID=85980 RepID=A0ACB8BC59_9AGAM|nr:hypothetical protein BV22DRAFT_1048487 [Leucogyrophana mollusca]
MANVQTFPRAEPNTCKPGTCFMGTDGPADHEFPGVAAHAIYRSQWPGRGSSDPRLAAGLRIFDASWTQGYIMTMHVVVLVHVQGPTMMYLWAHRHEGKQDPTEWMHSRYTSAVSRTSQNFDINHTAHSQIIGPPRERCPERWEYCAVVDLWGRSYATQAENGVWVKVVTLAVVIKFKPYISVLIMTYNPHEPELTGEACTTETTRCRRINGESQESRIYVTTRYQVQIYHGSQFINGKQFRVENDSVSEDGGVTSVPVGENWVQSRAVISQDTAGRQVYQLGLALIHFLA